jgi:anaphase-promoting complex subunit 1
MKQSRLLLLSRRTLALSIGRGMLTLGSLQPIVAEQMPLPEIVLKGKVFPTNAILTLDTSECPPEWRVWSDFHNGVAVGLQLPSSHASNTKITRTWIVYNKPPLSLTVQAQEEGSTPYQVTSKIHGHGGFLYALGLRGHLSCLEMSDLYDYLTMVSCRSRIFSAIQIVLLTDAFHFCVRG